jgi:hypothetical protein
MPLFALLHASSATPEFRLAVEAFARSGSTSQRVAFAPGAPVIKVERTLTKILGSYSNLPIDSVQINGTSGCDFFRGSALIRTTEDQFCVDFDWNCRWKALQVGWTDYFGYPDQTRAAREFGFDCFKSWFPRPVQV